MIYKGWSVEKTQAVQLGYRTKQGHGRGRKIAGYTVTHSDHMPQGKWCDTVAEAKAYIDEWTT